MPSGLGHHDRARQAIEEGLIQFRLQLLDLLAERRLRDMLALRRMREAPLLRDCDKIAELMNLHRATIRWGEQFVEVPGLTPPH